MVGILNKIPDAIQSNEEQMAEAEKRRNQLRKLQSAWDDVERLSKVELPELNSQLDVLSVQKTNLSTVQENVN